MLYRPKSDRPWRVVLYSHDSQGLGHIRRNIALAHSMAEHLPQMTGRSVTGIVFTGFDSMGEQLPEGFDHVCMPGLVKKSGQYSARRLDLSMSRLIRIRSQLLQSTINAFEPDLVIVDRHALGFRGELEWALTSLRENRPHVAIVLGLREILDDPESAAAEWERMGDPETIAETFDAIWLYGDPSVHNALATGEIPTALSDIVTHTGYLANGRVCRHVENPEKYVLTMVGGGSDGHELCEAAAQAPIPEGYTHYVVTGPQMAAESRERIAYLATERTKVISSVTDGYAAITNAACLVSMAGYNTVAEAMTTSVPQLLVPRSKPRLEQVIRAKGLAAIGAADTLSIDEASPEAVGAWIANAVNRSVDRSHLDLDGLNRIGELAAIELVGHAAASLEGAYA